MTTTDAWGGGGLFDADGKGITLNHRTFDMGMGEGFKLPANFRVRPHGEHPGWGEDNPIMSHRLERDGWSKIHDGKQQENKRDSTIWIEYTEPEIWEKKSEAANARVQIELHGIKEKQGPWYVQELKYIVEGNEVSLGRCDWADIDASGTLFFSNEGKLYKKMSNGTGKLIADLSQNTFTEVSPTLEVQKW